MKTKTQTKPQQQPPRKPAKKKKYVKWIIIAAVIVAVAVAAALLLPKLLGNSGDSARITTYNVEEVTYGNVSTTISGSGNLTPVSKTTFSAEYEAEITAVNFAAGGEVAADDVIMTVTYTVVDRFGNESTDDAEITAPYDGIILELSVAVGDTVSQGDTLCMVMGKDGYTMDISVDELNISYVELGQSVQFSIDAVTGAYTGTVSSISYNGSTSGSVTSYKIKAKLDYIEGVYPGMSASANIVIEDSGNGLLVPVDAVYTSGDTNYVYLAPSDAETGTEYDESAIDLNKMTKVTVTTGMSDGSYTLVESDSLSEGSRILVKKVTSTATGSDTSSRSDRDFPGGSDFPGGNFPGGGLDFGDFDPSNRPSGGIPSGFGG
ncbi:MAG: HlyD family efflux transporter periplasmic adaptor subunit [Clostridia bacterium]|nr:HlyD family efflux transporter periplasmic adaptor subunit [Clostridia bacterium]